MKEKIKNFKIDLKIKNINILSRLTLLQQLIVILAFMALFVVVILMSIVDNNLSSIIDNYMYETLESSQYALIEDSYYPIEQYKTTYWVIYDSSSNMWIKSNMMIDNINTFYYYLFGADLQNVLSNSTVIQNKGTIGENMYYYCITEINDSGQYLISIIDSEYSNDLISDIKNQIVYIQYGFFVVIALVMIAWVFSLINPLKKIKNYIDDIKLGKDSELNIDREDEIGVVSKALVSMKESLDQQEKIKEEMIHNMSHDLKTPIALIQTYSQSVKDDIYPYGDKDSSMDIIIENADRLEHKVKSFLYLNRLDYLQGENKELETFDMKQLIEKIVSQMDALNDLQLLTELDNVSFIGDEEHWRVAIENIIANASRYAHTQIKIILKDKYLEIYNDGEPLEEEAIPYLFDPYVKGVKGQFGLGLSIVAKIADMFGYNITAKNQKIGVSFIFTKK
ncbi:MAG: HAMP domain-containing histidine kinase [Erysipelotrichaceae bacterium]|nr:HAMP domain-containing histidine kinase [Erysipelotrichaceae bacterium]